MSETVSSGFWTRDSCFPAVLSEPMPCRATASAAVIDHSGQRLRVEERPGYGRITIATRRFEKGEILLTETPVVSVQLPGNEAVNRMCAMCCCQLGTAACQFGRMGVQHVPAAAGAHDAGAAAAVPCRHCDRTFYCCEEHRDAHFAQSHGALCSASQEHRAAFDDFHAFAVNECQTMMLAAEMFAASVLESGLEPAAKADSFSRKRSRTSRSQSALPTWLDEYVCAPWPDVVSLQCATADQEAEIRANCRATLREGRKLLLRTVRAGGFASTPAVGWLSETTWERLVGLPVLNATAVLPASSSPVRGFLETLVRNLRTLTLPVLAHARTSELASRAQTSTTSA